MMGASLNAFYLFLLHITLSSLRLFIVLWYGVQAGISGVFVLLSA